jgi:hypothetical protein
MKIKSKRFVIQKYIEKPLLMDGKKFDIRLFILISPSGKVYYFQEMYIRVSAYPFDLDNMQKFGHLNNIALQKYSKDYDGEKAVITEKMLEEHIKNNFKPDFDYDMHIRPKLKQIICIMSACLIEKFTTFHSKKKNFEIFGLDFMIDQDLDVWLIEANTNPALSTGNSYLDQLIPRMLDDALKLTLDKLFQPPKMNSAFVKFVGINRYQEILSIYENTKYPLLDHDDSANLWKQITNEDIEKSLESNPN